MAARMNIKGSNMFRHHTPFHATKFNFENVTSGPIPKTGYLADRYFPFTQTEAPLYIIQAKTTKLRSWEAIFSVVLNQICLCDIVIAICLTLEFLYTFNDTNNQFWDQSDDL